jgi:hypothetical protein
MILFSLPQHDPTDIALREKKCFFNFFSMGWSCDLAAIFDFKIFLKNL